MKATKDHLLKRTGQTGQLVVDGMEFEIRALSRAQAVDVHEAGSILAGEAMLLHLGMVDPAMTLDEAEQWQASDEPGAAGIIQALSQGIGRMSGMSDDSGKAATKSTGRRRRAGV